MILIIFALFGSSIKKRIKNCDNTLNNICGPNDATYTVEIDKSISLVVGNTLTVTFKNGESTVEESEFGTGNVEFKWLACKLDTTPPEGSAKILEQTYTCKETALGEGTSYTISQNPDSAEYSYIQFQASAVEGSSDYSGKAVDQVGPVLPANSICLSSDTTKCYTVEISGPLAIGGNLTAVLKGTEPPIIDTANFDIKWYKCAQVENCETTPLNDQNSETLPLESSKVDVGNYIKLVVSGKNTYTGTSEYKTTGTVKEEMSVSITFEGDLSIGATLTAAVSSTATEPVTYKWNTCPITGSCDENDLSVTTPNILIIPSGDNILDKFIQVTATDSEGLVATKRTEKIVCAEGKADAFDETTHPTHECVEKSGGDDGNSDSGSDSDPNDPGSDSGSDSNDPGSDSGSDSNDPGSDSGSDSNEPGSDSGSDQNEPGPSDSDSDTNEPGSSNSDNEPSEPVVSSSVEDPNPPGNKCLDKISNCISCKDDDHCAECENGFELSTDKTSCEKLEGGCDAAVLNCAKCHPEKSNLCIQCKDEYGLSGGICTKCLEGKFDTVYTECLPDCSSLPNCESCLYDKGVLECNRCINDSYTHSYNPEEGCILIADLPADYCKHFSDFCSECLPDKPYECKSCTNGYQLNYGYCECLTPNTEYDGKCYDLTETTCAADFEDKNCVKCLSNQCIKCNYGFGLLNGKCTELDCSKITNCATACDYVNNQLVCSLCNPGFFPNEAGTECVEEQFGACSAGAVPGCIECSNNKNKCNKCDKEKGFNENPNGFNCECVIGFELINGECVQLMLPIKPVEEPRIDITTDMYETVGNSGDSIKVTGSSDNYSALYEMGVDGAFNKISVSDQLKDIAFNVNGKRTDANPLEINPENKETKITLQFSDDSAIKIPPSGNVNLKGSGNIAIAPIEEEGSQTKDITIQKVVPQKGEMTLTPAEGIDNLIITEIQSFGVASFKGAEGKKITCKELLIEGGSDFTSTNVILEKVKIGLKSALNLKSPDTKFNDNCPITLYYNRKTNDRHFPIVISKATDGYPDLTKTKISVDYIDADKLLPLEEEEKFNIAQFNDGTLGENWAECDKLVQSNVFQSSDFGDAKCYNVSDTEVNLIAQRVEKTTPTTPTKKKGLSGGAIAGIVIACVVVAAAIIALLVYFLVIKKKNQSTTSTQGDSSIAI